MSFYGFALAVCAIALTVGAIALLTMVGVLWFARGPGG